MTQPGYDINALRKDIPILEKYIPLNNCSQAPQTAQTLAAAQDYLKSWQHDGMDWDRWMTEVESARAAFAGLINASVDEIAITTSVSAAAASVASAIDFFGKRHRIIVSEAEFPTTAHIWQAHEKYGAIVFFAPLVDEMPSTEPYDQLIDQFTRLVSVCHSYYLNGALQNIAEIAEKAHAAGALIFVDAYQSMGVVPIDVKALGVDFLATGTHKYLLGTPGIGFLYIRSSILDKLHPAVTGWFGRENPFAFQLRPLDWSSTARRFDTGTPPVFNAYVANAGLKIINSVGVDAISAWTQTLSAQLTMGAKKRKLKILGTCDVSSKTPSTAFVCNRDSHAVENDLRKNGILASARGPVIRLAPHYYNTQEEIETALNVLEKVI